jgi:hypothetical protein
MCGGSRRMAFDASDGVAMERAVYPGLIDLSGYPRPPSTAAIHDPHS